jgi:hypothetical protein
MVGVLIGCLRVGSGSTRPDFFAGAESPGAQE